MVTAPGQAHFSLPAYTLSQVLSIANSASLRVNMGCVLVYIPSLVGGAYVWGTVLQKGYLSNAWRGCALHPWDGLSKKFSCWDM